MLAPIPLLLAGLALVIAAFTYAWWQSASVGRHAHRAPTPKQLGLGAVTLFFDTLGIGNYAPTTAAFRRTCSGFPAAAPRLDSRAPRSLWPPR